MAKSSIGIYLSARYVDIVELSGSSHSPRLLNFVREEIPPLPEQRAEGSEEKAASYKECIASAIKEGLGKIKSKSNTAHTVLRSGEAIIRYFSMPHLPRSEHSQAVRFESKKYIPFKLNEIVSDFRAVSNTNAKKTMDVFFIAATKEQLNSHMDIFKQAGIDAVGIDIIPFALMRTLMLARKAQPKENIAIIYIDNDNASASIHVMEKGMPFFSRDLNISTDDKEAFFEKIGSEARVSMDYYTRQRPRSEISKIIICGEKIFDGLDAYISDELKIITETHDELKGIKGAEKTTVSSIIAMGTALEGLGRSQYSVNLSPLAEAIKKRKIANIIVAESAIALFVIVASFLLSGIKVRSAMDELNAIKQQGKHFPKNTSGLPVKALKKLRDKSIEELEFMQLLLNNRISWADKLSRIANDLPEGVWVNRLIVQNKSAAKPTRYPTESTLLHSLSITGSSFTIDSSKETESINRFLTSLKRDKLFMHRFFNVELGSIDKREIGDYWVTTFKILASSSEERLDSTKRAERSKWQGR